MKWATIGSAVCAAAFVLGAAKAEAASFTIANDPYGYDGLGWVSPVLPLGAPQELLKNNLAEVETNGVQYITPPPVFLPGELRSPWQNSNFEDTGVFTSIDAGAEGWIDVAAISGPSDTFYIAWGSPDTYNTIEFYDENQQLIVFDGNGNKTGITGADLTPPDTVTDTAVGINFVTISLIDVEYSSVRLSTSQFAFEFAAAGGTPLEVNPIPLPAGVILLLSGLMGLGFLGRFRSKATG